MPRGERRFCSETTRGKKIKLQSARKKETNDAIRTKIFFNPRFASGAGTASSLLEVSRTLSWKIKSPMKIFFILLIMSTNAVAMDRWTALAILESGGNDRAVGRVGEISRYQIRPELWPEGSPLDARVALANARRIMSARVSAFEQSHGRRPNDFEFYVLWNAPAQINRPHQVVAERARRFVNLVSYTNPNGNLARN
jgi:hypothetical protein